MGSSTIPAGGGGGLAPKYQKFTSSGTFTLPDGYGVAKPLLVSIQVIGGGGGGAGRRTGTGSGSLYAQWNNYFGDTRNTAFSSVGSQTTATGTGGSGGLCSTQLYLTSNLTITVGAAGTRGADATITNYTGNNGNVYSQSPTYFSPGGAANGGGTGGTTTAGVLQATGGVGGNIGTEVYMYQDGSVGWINNPSHGAGGTPAGTAGTATPLLGTLAGGSTSSTPVRGSFGIGGVQTDASTSTGAEGTGGGSMSIGATGAVILTWWQ